MIESKIRNADFDAFYLVMGKALFIASDFENDLKALSIYLKIRVDIETLKEPQLLKHFFEKYQPPINRIRQIGLEPELDNVFEKAIKSRNYIAHELGTSIYNYDASQHSLNEFIETAVKPHVENVLIARYHLKSFWAQLNNEEMELNWLEKQRVWVYKYE